MQVLSGIWWLRIDARKLPERACFRSRDSLLDERPRCLFGGDEKHGRYERLADLPADAAAGRLPAALAHIGSPPVRIYLVRDGRRLFVGGSNLVFAALNWI